jgi:hypothetical protein
MEIGEEIETIVIEPIELPVPLVEPGPRPKQPTPA